MALMDEAAVSYQAVLTKIDKIKPTELDPHAAGDDGRAAQARGGLSRRSRDIIPNGSRDRRAARRDRALANM